MWRSRSRRWSIEAFFRCIGRPKPWYPPLLLLSGRNAERVYRFLWADQCSRGSADTFYSVVLCICYWLTYFFTVKLFTVTNASPWGNHTTDVTKPLSKLQFIDLIWVTWSSGSSPEDFDCCYWGQVVTTWKAHMAYIHFVDQNTNSGHYYKLRSSRRPALSLWALHANEKCPALEITRRSCLG